MRVAAIDIGTNSVRLLTARYEGDSLVDKQKRLTMTRIGKDVDDTGLLREDRIQDTLDALAQYREILEGMGVEQCPVFATSAVRDAANRQDFVDRVQSLTGFEVQVIDGETEAHYGFLGVIRGAGAQLGGGPSLIIDIGGGSTELIVGTASGQLLYSHSLNVGAVRMTDRHHLTHSSSWEVFEPVRRDVRSALEPLMATLNQEPIAKAFGIGGTATTIGAMSLQLAEYSSEAVHLQWVSREQVRGLAESLVSSSLEEKLQMKGLMSKRADIIAAGAVVLDTVLELFDLEGYLVSDDDNLEGALFAQRTDL